jgi:putative membrane protein
MLFARWRKNFAADQNRHSARFFRIWNEGPTLLMIIIVVMAVAKPF